MVPKTGAEKRSAAGQTSGKGTMSLTKSSSTQTRAATPRSAPVAVPVVTKTIVKPKNQNEKPNSKWAFRSDFQGDRLLLLAHYRL